MVKHVLDDEGSICISDGSELYTGVIVTPTGSRLTEAKRAANFVKSVWDYNPETGELTWKKRTSIAFFGNYSDSYARRARKRWNRKVAGTSALTLKYQYDQCPVLTVLKVASTEELYKLKMRIYEAAIDQMMSSGDERPINSFDEYNALPAKEKKNAVLESTITQRGFEEQIFEAHVIIHLIMKESWPKQRYKPINRNHKDFRWSNMNWGKYFPPRRIKK